MPDGVNQPCPENTNDVPVVLIHGTFANAKRAFKLLAPTLRKQGRCVFAINYGKRSKLPTVFATADMNDSAREIDAFIESVRTTTGAAQVDLVVTPIESQFLLEPSVTNLRLQQLFPGKFATHSGVLQDAQAVRFVSQWLTSPLPSQSTKAALPL